MPLPVSTQHKTICTIGSKSLVSCMADCGCLFIRALLPQVRLMAHSLYLAGEDMCLGPLYEPVSDPLAQDGGSAGKALPDVR